ncbi:hypothetical protein [Pseudomonas sp. efr-133-TYG-103a]|uniref:hypothetical protein n=1 Tax=Pseudomonas sp. efr-133-TYG-103a TaxID=3040308 RepID=UPI002555F21E|nr:hypothetical protein [Pseudomonas sp. efr-133-TYG-103a]
MDILWWEKTVEYFFVQKYVDLNMFIAPLDGDHEKAGDAIFANVNKWVLIEFKRDKSTIADEVGKFTNYESAKSALESIGSHHLIIYGVAENNNFLLRCRQYFSGKDVAIEQALVSGATKDSFINYLRKFVEFKKTSKSGAGGYSFVAGISRDGTVTKCMKVSEFAEALQLEKALQQKLQQKQGQSYSGPSRGM